MILHILQILHNQGETVAVNTTIIDGKSQTTVIPGTDRAYQILQAKSENPLLDMVFVQAMEPTVELYIFAEH